MRLKTKLVIGIHNKMRAYFSSVFSFQLSQEKDYCNYTFVAIVSK